MKMVKSLILGSAAGLLAMGGAQAADLPVKAKAVEYVRICSLYGAGFYYIPGTDTCIKLGGYVRIDTTFNGGTYGLPAYSSDLGQQNRYRDYFSTRSRMGLTVDGHFVLRARGVVLAGMRETLFLDLGRDPAARARLGNGARLSLADGARAYDFRLTSAAEALARLDACVRNTGRVGG